MDFELLSKEVSYALRHAPWEYELELDDGGWVPLHQLVESLKGNEKWKYIESIDIVEMISRSPKKRHEIIDGKIRAFYGHTVPSKIKKLEKRPPEFLYHGTTHKAIDNILKYGLKPCSRQYVHLSVDKQTAYEVGKRREDKPIILLINSNKAYNDGLKFYYGNDKVWLADNIPANYIIENDLY